MQEDFDMLALSVIDEIPYGKVSTYGQVANLMGFPHHARHVGKACSRSSYYGNFPCHRVVSQSGKLVTGWAEQKLLLEKEGIKILSNGLVDMKHFLWDGSS